MADITAPMPGKICEVKVATGDTVAADQEIVVLEAMKMKNSIRANRDGLIKKIFISTGDHVRQSQILMEFESEAD